MMLEDAFGLSEEASAVRQACSKAIAEGVCTEDIIPGSMYGTKAVGQYIVDIIKS
jgi:isocitrate/isopropylmalate dehydrogenase